jgi:hypothetical protein
VAKLYSGIRVWKHSCPRYATEFKRADGFRYIWDCFGSVAEEEHAVKQMVRGIFGATLGIVRGVSSTYPIASVLTWSSTSTYMWPVWSTRIRGSLSLSQRYYRYRSGKPVFSSVIRKYRTIIQKLMEKNEVREGCASGNR